MSFTLKNDEFEESDIQRNALCGCLRKFHVCLNKLFYNIGYIIGKHPSYFIIIPVFITLLFVTGVQTMIYEKDPEYLFSPTDSPGREERKYVEKMYPIDYSHGFDPSRITSITPFVRLIITAKDGETLLRKHIWDDIMFLDHDIRNISVVWQEQMYEYKNVCAIWDSNCIDNQVLDLNEIISDVESGESVVDYPIMLFPTVLPFYYGGVKVNESEGYIESLEAIVLHYWLKKDNWMQEERSLLWEAKALDLALRNKYDFINVSPFISKSLENELENNTRFVLSYLPSAVGAVVVFSLVSILSFDWVRSKIQIAGMGILTAGLATGCSFGLLMYLKVPFIGMNLAAPFILLGIGIDDMFVILSAWSRTKLQDNVPKRLATAYQEAAVSISITSLTNMLSFFIGSITPFPSVFIFCIYTGVSIMVTYLFYITFFGGCLAIAGYQERRQMHALTFKKIKSKSESVNDSFCFRLLCTGGINKEDPLNRKDNKPHFLMVCFRDYFSNALNTPVIKALIIVSFLLYLSGAIYGCFHVKEGLDKQNLALDSSYLNRYYELDESLFRKLPYRIQIVIKENITYSDLKTRRQLLKLHESFENLTCIGSKHFTQSWIRGFYRFVSIRPELRKNITDEKSFIRILKDEYLTGDTPEILDVVFNEDETQIISSRFIIQSYDIKDTNADKEMMLSLRKVAKDAPFEVIAYHPFFVFFDQFVEVAPLTIQSICLTAFIMMIVSLIFIPNPFCCLWVIFSIISIEVGVMGYMSLWGVSLDCISMINLIMCIGFSVDFSAHISYSYLTAVSDSPDERVRECMFNLGFPVIQSGLSTIAGVIVFIVAPSNIFRTFLKIIFLVIVFGMMHALLLLPVMLSLVGPGSCKKKQNSVPSLKKAIAHISKSNNLEGPTTFTVDKVYDASNKEKSSQSSGSTCSDVIQYTPDDSDAESMRASSHSQGSLEYEGSTNVAYEIDEDENHENGSTNL